MAVKSAVCTAVNAIIAQIERREHNDTVAVDMFFDLSRYLKDPFQMNRILICQKSRHLQVGQPLEPVRLVQYPFDFPVT